MTSLLGQVMSKNDIPPSTIDAPLVTLIVDRLPMYEVNDTFEFILGADRNLHSSCRHAKFGTDLIYNSPGISASPYSSKSYWLVTHVYRKTYLSILLTKEIRGT